MHHTLYIVFFFALGACVGSFLNVVVWRLPRGESLVSPPSRCPICEHRLAWYDNIPVFGWLALRGRCRYCFTPISAQYPTVEFITGALFVFYYVMYFIAGATGTCWREVPRISEHWPQYALAVFTISALLAASLIDAKQFWIPQSIPMLMALIGVLYHTILDRPSVPGSLNVDASAGAIALGAGIGLLISLALTYSGKLARSFAEGWPALEIEKDPPPVEEKAGGLAALVSRWIEKFRRNLTPEQQKTLKQHQAAAKEHEREEIERQKQEAADQPKIEHKEFTRADINREIRKEMTFLMPPILLAIAAFALVAFNKPLCLAWTRLLANNHWLSGFLGSLLGALVGAFVVWLTRILGSLAFGREAMGMGDVDLMFGVGAIIGAGPAVVAFFVAPFFGLALAIYMLLIGKRRELPYGPYLSLGTAFVMIYYCPIANYLRPGMMAMSQMISSCFGH